MKNFFSKTLIFILFGYIIQVGVVFGDSLDSKNPSSNNSFMSNIAGLFGVKVNGGFYVKTSNNIKNQDPDNNQIENIKNEIINIDSKLDQNQAPSDVKPAIAPNITLPSLPGTQAANSGNIDQNQAPADVKSAIDPNITLPSAQGAQATNSGNIDQNQAPSDVKSAIAPNIVPSLPGTQAANSGNIDQNQAPIDVKPAIDPNITLPNTPSDQSLELDNRKPINKNNNTKSSKLNKLDKNQPPSHEQLDFINNEIAMLLIPDGDFVTGEMREESYLYRVPFNEYVHIFWQSFETKEQRLNRENTDTYVRDYNSMFLKSINKEKLKKVESKAKSLALDSLNEENLDDFRTIIDRYKLISTKYEDGDNLLHLASKYDKKVIARYLLAKGINQFDLNKNKQTAYYIANLLQNFDIVRLLLNARITKHLYY